MEENSIVDKPKRNRRSGSKKGTPFEREICRRLSMWWSQDDPNGVTDSVFWRTSQSGGWATTRAKAGKKGSLQCSDLHAIDPAGDPLIKLALIELKKGYMGDTIHDLLDRPERYAKQQYEEWIAKAEEDRQRAGSYYWMLIHMRDRREPLVWMPAGLIDALSDAAFELDASIEWSALIYLPSGIHIGGMPLSRFFTCITPSIVREVLARQEKVEKGL